MGLIHKKFLDDPSRLRNHPNDQIVGCSNCSTHLSTHSEILSKQFQGSKGKAYLFNRVINVIEGRPEDRNMTTGLHTVRDIMCTSCQAVVGWKYDRAYEESQRYKEGRYILERAAFRELAIKWD